MNKEPSTMPSSAAAPEILAKNLRAEILKNPKGRAYLIFAYNGTGKTRLCTAFKDLDRTNDKDPHHKLSFSLNRRSVFPG